MTKRILSIFLLLSMIITLSVYVGAEGIDIEYDGASGKIPLDLTIHPMTFSVTVPSNLPVEVESDGTVIVSTDNKIINNSNGPVEVTDISISVASDWYLTNFDTDFTKMNVDTRQLGMTFNGLDVRDNKDLASSIGTIGPNSSKSFTYDVRLATQSVNMSTTIASVIITIGWKESETYSEQFADASWDEILRAARNGDIPETWTVGSTKAMNIGDVTYNLRIIGRYHDEYADGSGLSPLTIQLVDCYTDSAQMNQTSTNVTGWSASYLRTVTLVETFEKFPQEFKDAIKPVKKYTVEGKGKNPENPTNLEETHDKLFLLSETEVLGTKEQSGVYEGKQYEYYANGGSPIKHLNGKATIWWLRGPRYTSDARYSGIYTTGVIANGGANGFGGIAFAFCL